MSIEAAFTARLMSMGQSMWTGDGRDCYLGYVRATSSRCDIGRSSNYEAFNARQYGVNGAGASVRLAAQEAEQALRMSISSHRERLARTFKDSGSSNYEALDARRIYEAVQEAENKRIRQCIENFVADRRHLGIRGW